MNVGAHETIHTVRTPGGTAMPSSHHASEMERTNKSCWWREQVDCSRAGWTGDRSENAVGHERFTARESTAHCCGRTGPDGDEHMDGRGLRTRAINMLQLVQR